MITLNVTQATDVILNGTLTKLQPQSYKTKDEKFCKENDFIKCFKCKNYFDESWQFTKYHFKYDRCKDKTYCKECFNLLDS